MRKLIGVVTACLLLSGAAQAQKLSRVFINMPDSLSGVLTKINREDCVDFLDSHMKARVTNRYDRQSELLTLTDDYLCMQLTPENTWEMKLLQQADSTQVVCWVRTFCAPVCDSRVEFFTADWQPLEAADYLTQPQEDDFFLTADSLHADSLALLRSEADLTFLRATLSADEASISFYYTTMDYVTRKTAEKLKAYLRETPLRYEWVDGKFVRR